MLKKDFVELVMEKQFQLVLDIFLDFVRFHFNKPITEVLVLYFYISYNYIFITRWSWL